MPSSGFTRKTNLDIPTVDGEPDAPITVEMLNALIARVNRWGQSLKLARTGYQLASLDDVTVGGVVTDVVVSFAQITDDSQKFVLDTLASPRNYAQVPPSLGNIYNITYNAEFFVATPTVTTYNYTGANQTFTVPAGVTLITIECNGAEGAPGDQGAGILTTPGKGGKITTLFSVTPGQIYDITVGGAGAVAVGGWPNGGAGDAGGGSRVGGGGGASSSVKLQGNTFAQSLIVAAGGGGGASLTVNGGNGGYLNGGADSFYLGSGAGAGYSSGQGASQTAGGIAGWGVSFSPVAVQDGNAGAFNQGAAAGNTTNALSYPGGGGGGGWFGGGSAGIAAGAGSNAGSGGGGSGKVQGSVGTITTVNGTKVGNGQVKISYDARSAATATELSIKIWVAYKTYPYKAFVNYPPYSKKVVVAAANGLSPFNGAVHVKLSEGDRIWMTVTNTNALMKFSNLTLSAYAVGYT